jgi:predicted nucleotidyltransferase component of viral defense system
LTVPAPLGARNVVELFHLIFLRALFSDVADKTLLAIKGGINLRLFFESVRFSEDLDLDIMTMSKETLEKRIDRLLQSPVIVSPLRARGLIINDVSKPKQTDTVQRWNLGVAARGTSIDERTKIEFSRRANVETARLEPVAAEVARTYAIPPFLATHYRCPEAVRQKIHALEGRAETQPRDVFDLHVLFARPDAPTALDEEARAWTEKAATNVAALTYDHYRSLVVAYLEPAHADIYSSRETWEAMQTDVMERILALG